MKSQLPRPRSTALEVQSDREAHERSDGRASIAVVGMACRFPGADDLAAFWRLLEAGENTVTHGSPGPGDGRVNQMFPDETPVHPASRYGSFLRGIDQFDAEFFRISPLEAESLDPQQRLLLEVSWEALEDAGIAPERLEGSRTGVYAGIGSYEYQELVRGASEPVGEDATLYLLTGNRFSTASGRVSFVLGFEGPSVAVDTACSSSLVAVHQAMAGLGARRGGSRHRGRGVRDPLAADDGGDGQCRDAVADGTMLDVRRAGGWIRAERGLRAAGTEAARRGGGCGRPDLGGDPRLGDQPGRIAPGAVGADAAHAGARHRGCAGARSRGAVAGRLSRGARDRNEAGRSRRNRGGRVRLWSRTGRRAAAARGLGQDQYRPPGRWRRGGGPDQGAAGDAPRRHPEAPQPQQSESGYRVGPAAGAGHDGADRVARPAIVRRWPG